MFGTEWITDQICRITDRLGAGMTLIMGSERALLIDTGYGLDPLPEFLRQLVSGEMMVCLTHAHHDHAMGCRFFDQVYAFEPEHTLYPVYTDSAHRRAILERTAEPVDQDAYLTARMPPLSVLCEQRISLGDVHIRPCLVPGHTPGSAMFLVEEQQLLVTGDNWNPETWLFFPEALPLPVYLANMRSVLQLPFTRMVCSHSPGVFHRSVLEEFLSAIEAGGPVRERYFEGHSDRTDIVQMDLPHGQRIVFDKRKAAD